MSDTPLNIEALKKSETNANVQEDITNRFSATKKKTKDICFSLSSPSKDFNPKQCFSIICELTTSKKYLSRILYSEFSGHVFSLGEQDRGTFDTNTEALFQYVNSEVETNKEAVDFVIKIYDHLQLAKVQLENVDHTLKDKIEEAKKSIETDSKRLEKEYISILGIFASVVLAFIGGSIFSTSVLENISNANIFRIVFIVDFLAFFIISLIYLLVVFIMKINGTSRQEEKENFRGKKKKKGFFPIKMIYSICLLVALLDIIAWAIDIKSLIDFVVKGLPWIK